MDYCTCEECLNADDLCSVESGDCQCEGCLEMENQVKDMLFDIGFALGRV